MTAAATARPSHMLGIGAAAQALGVSVDTLRRWERSGRIAFKREGGRRVIAAADVAQLLREPRSGDGLGTPNKMDGIVVSVLRGDLVARVEIACGPFRMVSVMPRAAVDKLGLEPGSPATALVKPTQVSLRRAPVATAAG